jgi:hypothetical protein
MFTLESPVSPAISNLVEPETKQAAGLCFIRKAGGDNDLASIKFRRERQFIEDVGIHRDNVLT